LLKAFHVLEKRKEMCSSGSSWRGCTVAAPVSLSPIFLINTGESTRNKRADERIEKNKKKERRIAEKEENRGREREQQEKEKNKEE
jgi:hypothetical protein